MNLSIRALAASACIAFSATCALAQTTSSVQVKQSASNVVEARVATPAVTPAVTSTAVTTPGGTAGLVPVWTGTSTIGPSIIYQTSSGIGIGKFPNATLDINGTSTFRGSMGISRSGDATTSAGTNSFPILMQSSVYNSSKGQNVLPYFQLMTEPVGNNTASAGATLNFMYYSGVGSAPSETGLYINGNGNIHFAPTQTFPITQGPAGPQGPVGPAGPKGAAGATGPQGPAGTLALPYSATANGGGKYLFTLTDTGTAGGGGIYASGETGANPEGVINVYTTGGSGVTGQGGVAFNSYGSTGGAGVVGMGGASGSAESAYGGSGVVGVGGNATSTYSIGGAGGTFTGGSASSNPAGNGINAIGGAALGEYPAGDGIYAQGGSGGDLSYAGEFQGDVDISGNLSKSGGSFKIDDPIDPANKYLYHSFVESPDMMNIYNGNIITDGRGEAVVTMPDYFQALNTDFRYQLTTIGQPAQAYVASEISGNTFVIKTDRPNVKVSWQVTGVRQDAWANAHRIPNEVDKEQQEKGYYLHPELFGHANEASILELRHSARLPAQPQ